MRAVVLLSGGLDSATTLAIGRSWGFECTALTFRYGQRHALEVDAALRVGQALGVVAHQVLSLDPSGLAGSALTGEGAIPRDRSREEIGHAIPATYVPARNTIFLAYALGRAETVGAADVFLGVNAVDYSGYPDCRPEYIEAFERMANLATRAGVEGALRFKVHTPLIALTKKEIIQRGMALGVDYGLTLSCYDPDDSGAACGGCDACVLRLEGFTEAGVRDPARYRAGAGVER